MIKIKKLSELTFDEALNTWNDGFEGYVYNQKMTLNQFIQRFGFEDLLPEVSIVAFVNGEPAGIVLNGIRVLDGKKVGWNGGTGVAVKYRRSGVGKAMMEATLKLYKEHGVETATLEAAKSNEKAINLYKKFGYDIIDDLVFLENKEPLTEDAFTCQTTINYETRSGIALEAGALSIIENQVPWQTHWKSLRRDGELLVVSDNGQDIGYFLFKKQYKETGELAGILLFSAGLAPNRSDKVDIAKVGLKSVFSPLNSSLRRATFNFPAQNKEVVTLLQSLNFTSYSEQVFMVRNMD